MESGRFKKIRDERKKNLAKEKLFSACKQKINTPWCMLSTSIGVAHRLLTVALEICSWSTSQGG
jgi:hypothetical protein